MTTTKNINPWILPISYFIEPKELILLSNIIDGRYDVDMEKFYHLYQSKRRGTQFVLPKVTSETLRLKFWYRAPPRAKFLLKSVTITDHIYQKKITYLNVEKKFNSTFNEELPNCCDRLVNVLQR